MTTINFPAVKEVRLSSFRYSEDSVFVCIYWHYIVNEIENDFMILGKYISKLETDG